MHLTKFETKMFDIMSMMDETRMDFPKVIFHQFKKYYPDCRLNFDDINVIKKAPTTVFRYTYDIRFSDNLKAELLLKYPEYIL